ncbi:uncharacterized protein LOC107407537 isoform X2 [Ziziphus jujuba]|uniref:Uncharacterized protein LOC107407537 isoform X2 n=1 Tax=Ziziphus jujuba TaxID=326968 RepID=A0ABM3IFA3_ZIZJJ|nr:uncharacterized protein LOC107407537 isoform X2 [Ziziphus jujuba]
MSVACGVECVVVLGCLRWAWKRCTYIGNDDSATWPTATPEEFERVPHICRLILAVYEPDLRNPQYPPPGGYRLNPDWLVKRVTYEETQGRSPPYIIYADHDNREIVLAIRGLNLVKESDYKLLLDNRIGMQMFDGGYAHHGLLKSATWLLNQESETLKKLWLENGSNYRMVFAGHSLGSGVASLLTVIVANHIDRLGGVPRDKIRCYAIAPARCMSLNLAVKYADVIHSVILQIWFAIKEEELSGSELLFRKSVNFQDDFLPRTATPLEDIFKSLFCLPCLLFLICLRDTFIPEGRKLRDPRRLYAPGRMYHIVERRFCRCGRYPPEVRTAIPVDGRFEHIVLSCNATSDHGIIWIEREAEKAIKMMKESSGETLTTPPKVQRLERLQTIEKEHKDALERAVSLNIPHAVTSTEEHEDEEEAEVPRSQSADAPEVQSKSNSGKTNWDELVETLMKKKKLGNLATDASPSQ